MSTKNRTLSIIGRTMIVVALVAILHTVARLIYIWDDTFTHPVTEKYCYDTYNLPPVDPTQSCTVYKDFASVDGKTFANYPFNNAMQVLTTHYFAFLALGIVVGLLLIVGGIIYFIAVGTSKDKKDPSTHCQDVACKCAYHYREEFRNGEWQTPDCSNAACTCGHHADQVFKKKKQIWV